MIEVIARSEPRVLVILGSSRADSDTLSAVKELCPYPSYEILDLRDYPIAQFDYDQARNRDDAFVRIADRMLTADVIVFATPIYWYSMSGLMKAFFDRLTDLTGLHKPIGKALKGKRTHLIASGGGPELPEGFEVPFRRTSEYFDMEFIGSFYRQAPA